MIFLLTHRDWLWSSNLNSYYHPVDIDWRIFYYCRCLFMCEEEKTEEESGVSVCKNYVRWIFVYICVCMQIFFKNCHENMSLCLVMLLTMFSIDSTVICRFYTVILGS